MNDKQSILEELLTAVMYEEMWNESYDYLKDDSPTRTVHDSSDAIDVECSVVTEPICLPANN